MEIIESDGRGQIENFFRVVSRVVKKVKIDELTNFISKLDRECVSLDDMDEIVDYILDCVVEEFKQQKVTKDKLFDKERKGRGYTKVALNMAMVVIRLNLKVSDDQVSKYFNRVRQVSFRAMQQFKSLNPKIPDDVRYMEKFERVNNKVKIYIQEINQQHS